MSADGIEILSPEELDARIESLAQKNFGMSAMRVLSGLKDGSVRNTLAASQIRMLNDVRRYAAIELCRKMKRPGNPKGGAK